MTLVEQSSKDSSITVCAFIDGYASAADEPFDDFRRWLVARGASRPELGWPWLVLAEIYPPDDLPSPRGFSEAEDKQALAVLFDLLESYYASFAA